MVIHLSLLLIYILASHLAEAQAVSMAGPSPPDQEELFDSDIEEIAAENIADLLSSDAPPQNELAESTEALVVLLGCTYHH